MASRGKKADGQDRTPYTNDKRMKQRKLGLRGKGHGILGDQLKTQMDAAELPTSVLAGTENPADPNYVPPEEQQRDLVAKMEAAKLEEEQQDEQEEYDEEAEQQGDEEQFDQAEEYDENEEYQGDESEQQQPAESVETKATQPAVSEKHADVQSKPVQEVTGEYQCLTAEQQKEQDKVQSKGAPQVDPNKPVKAELQIGTNPEPSPGESASKTAGSRFSAPPDPHAPPQGPTLERDGVRDAK
jgi:hypothetical protein